MRAYTVVCTDPDLASVSYGIHEIEAEGMTTGPNGELVFLVGGEPAQVFAPGVWAHAKAEEAEDEGDAAPTQTEGDRILERNRAGWHSYVRARSSNDEVADAAIAAVASQYKGVRSPEFDVTCVGQLVREDLTKFRRVIAPHVPEGADAAEFEQDVLNRSGWLCWSARQAQQG